MRLKLPSFCLSSAALAFAALLPAAAQTQDATPPATPQVRITEPVAGSPMVTLKGNTHPMAQARYDRGAASTSMATGKLQLLLKRSPAQQVALRSYLGSLQDPNSASYHKWLTPATYGAQFGIAEQDLQTVEAWLQQQGFKIESVPASRNFIQFSGTTGEVAQAFHTSIHSYVINGVQHYSNASDPQIPAALTPVVAGISPLNDFHSQPQHVLHGRAQVRLQNGHVQAISQTASQTTPQLTIPLNNSNYLFLTPGDMATIYDSPNALNGNYNGTAQQTGTGVTIGLVGDSDLAVADYLNYRKLFLNEANPANPTTIVDGVDPGVVAGGSAVEALVDAEFSAGLAPGASISFYSSADANLQDGATDAAYRAVQDNTVSILSVSFGICEFNLGPDGNASISELWEQAAAQGITVLVASGDTGSAACDASDPGNPSQASGGLSVSGYASTPYNIAVGGTDFDVLANSFTQYVSTANPVTTNPYSATALGYIPENPWNDSISNNPPGSYVNNTATLYTDPNGGPNASILAAGGGGPSNAAICNGSVDSNGNCLGTLQGYATPPFQTGLPVSNPGIQTGVRYIPDVSLFASPGDQHNATWALCSDASVNPDEPAGEVDCTLDANNNFNVYAIGGTSASTPAFAGVLAMVLQSLGTNGRLGLANNTLYNLQATSSNNANIFHDITAGNNSVPCVTGTASAPDPDCGTNNFLNGYDAGTGYDLATGLGSVDIAQLINSWDQVHFNPTSVTFTVNGGNAPINVVHGTAITLAANVSPTSATGDVSITGATNAGGAAAYYTLPLTTGAGSLATGGTSNVAALPGGSYNLQAYYEGDVQNSPSTSGTIPVNITPEPSTLGLNLIIFDPVTSQSVDPTQQVYYGQYGDAYVTAGNASGTVNGIATGQVTLLNNGTTAALPSVNNLNVNPQAINSQGNAVFPLYDLAPGQYSFSASYAGDVSYQASSTSGTVPLTILKGNTTLSINASSTSIAASGSVTVVVELDTDSEGNLPTNAITLTAGGTPLTGSAPAAGTFAHGALFQQVTFTIPGSALASGANTLQASYAGDGNYNGSSAAPVTITVTGGTGGSGAPGFGLSAQTASLSIASPGQSTPADTITISPTNGFTGTVNLTCQVQFTGLGALPSCTLGAPSVSITGTTAATTTVTIGTTASSALAAPRRPGDTFRHLLEGSGGVALCSLLLFSIPSRRRSWQRMVGTVLLVLGSAGALTAIGCGGSSNSHNGTPAGNYTVVVTGTSGSTTANTQLTVAVQ